MYKLKLIHNLKTDTRVYIYDNKVIDVDVFNNIMSRWELYYRERIKQYKCERNTQIIYVWYIK